ncbi:NAD(P)H-hydrate epimerase [Melghirimyces profundicolus]|uniref:Bifunctional NAD(P)H-hydrate repair enzyme n=1 Tax=Melghirimyces profundicolus TaxID=1242148 RepID=A0A2T6BS32_9BACL|nr:NAD(P)H-hydrate dehydratase [Melghirimyces profundicolus]PTX58890.1 NAD(P)H-hydrate epimerase [Melghirimyces profundicolus]
MYLYTAQEMRDLDRYTIESMGMPGVALMENAGGACARTLMKRFPEAKRVVVLAGSGNNGGDGFVIARYLSTAGWNVSVWRSGPAEKMSPETRAFHEVCRNMGLAVKPFEPGREGELTTDLGQADVAVDALLGTGVRGELREPVRRIVQTLNRSRPPFLLSVDVPSGVNTDTGEVAGEAVHADLTVTFAAPKWCHYLLPGAKACGEVEVAPIGIPQAAVERHPPRTRINGPALWEDHLLPRSRWSHKGTHGHLLVLGGSRGMLGAAALSGMAALRTGAGMVTLGVPQGQEIPLSAKVTEALVWGWPEGDDRCFTRATPPDWEKRLSGFDAVAVGPGLGRFDGETEWLEDLLFSIPCPLVLDADALNGLAGNPSILKKRGKPTVLTPHPGEMARLTGISVKEVESSRHRIALELAEKTGAAVVLKGTYTVIAFPDGRQVVNTTGTPALAKAGSGDVLTGVLGALLARGLPVESAIPLGVHLHGLAGRLAVTASDHSVLASDVIEKIGDALHQAR